MSPTFKNATPSTPSSPSSTSSQRRSYPPTTARKDPNHRNRRDIHSAPATFAHQPPNKQASDLTLYSSSSGSTSSSTALASSTTSTSPSPTQNSGTKPKTHITHHQLSAEDAYYSQKINAEHAAKTAAEASIRNGVARTSGKQKRGCMGALADEFDFGYANLATRDARGGRKVVGGPAVGKCELM